MVFKHDGQDPYDFMFLPLQINGPQSLKLQKQLSTIIIATGHSPLVVRVFSCARF